MKRFLLPSTADDAEKRQATYSPSAWACSACTFWHEGVLSHLNQCTICDAPRPAKKEASSPPSQPPPASRPAQRQEAARPSLQPPPPSGSAFAALMQGARQAAKVFCWNLAPPADADARGDDCAFWRPVDRPQWSCELTLRMPSGGSQRVRLCTPLAPSPPPVAFPLLRLSGPSLSQLLSLLKSALQKNVRLSRVQPALCVAEALLMIGDSDGLSLIHI